MASVDLGNALSTGVNTFKANAVNHIIVFIVFSLVTNVSFGLLIGPMIVGYFKYLTKEASGAKPEIGDLFKGFDQFVPALVAGIVAFILIVIGSFLCIIPGLLIAPLLPVALLLVARGEKDGIQALQKGWAFLKPNLLMAAVSMVVIQIIGQIGIFACFVGLLVTGPIAMIASWHLATQILGDASEVVPAAQPA